jgi:hypothetical protein
MGFGLQDVDFSTLWKSEVGIKTPTEVDNPQSIYRKMLYRNWDK